VAPERVPPYWLPGEKPPYAFCESVTGIGPWHIRKLGPAGLKLGGGIDTPSLCGRLRPLGDHTAERLGGGGWDLEVRITPGQLTPPPVGTIPHVCRDCPGIYRKETGK
jgi:hypothetical protein